MQPNANKNSDAQMRIFYNACSSGETTELARLITHRKFDVNNSSCRDFSPLWEAINFGSLPVVTILLDHGANTNCSIQRKSILTLSIQTKRLEFVKLLIDRGVDITANNFEGLRVALKDEQQDKVILELLINALATQLTGNQGVCDVNKKQKMLKGLQLIRAILQSDAPRIAKLLRGRGYTRYLEVIGNEIDHRPGMLAFRFGGLDVIEALVQAGVDLETIYIEAAARGDVRTLELCLENPELNNFYCHDPVLYEDGTALDVACTYRQLEIVKVLIIKYGLIFDVCSLDSYHCSCGKSPIYTAYNSEFLPDVLAAFPLHILRAPPSIGYSCSLFAVVLEMGTYTISYLKRFIRHRYCRKNCYVMSYLYKLFLIDADYANNIMRKVIILHQHMIEEFQKTRYSFGSVYKAELEKMQGIRISQGTTEMKGKSLLDFLYLSPNQAARYSKNQIVLGIYEKYDKDFQKFLPHYGFQLNRHLKRGKFRRELFDFAIELLCLAIGSGLPEDFTELIFGHLSNDSLERFKLESTVDPYQANTQ